MDITQHLYLRNGEVGNKMDYKAIEQLIKTAGETGLTYLDIETEGIHITMKKGSLKGENEVILAESEKENLLSKVEINEPKEAIKTEEKIVDDENVKTITSPIVGTYYASADPKNDAFVKIGSKVKKGDTLCIIEAMKLMNEIDSEFDGEIVEVLVENEQMVEYGQGLFKIRCN
ncbi:acetyl-CoA carboxylase biotin carboxyl carrier protein [Clostridium acidisoli DSM 12555]|uniref:Biotin carboxyl carrier protein of acetyl-CoA carboxylase n=2 Tax=Clostridium TaxID=1485 RepID=A0A1W1XRU9_9CLOT|nr:acetyl-CoA carboxylase biotin carboxyl carrier protein [Clostridium acidisoli DSM 12555]